MNLAVVTLEDRRAVYALLDRFLDWLPPTRLAVPRAETTAAAGVGRWARCETCAGTGRLTGAGKTQKPCRLTHDRWPAGHGCRPCPAGCAQGLVRLHGKAAETGADPMIERVVGKETGVDVTATELRLAKRRWADAQIVKIRSLEAQREGRLLDGVTAAEIRLPAEAAPDDWTRAHDARERQWRTGSYRALELALELLAATAPLRFEALRVYAIEQHFTPDTDLRARLDEIVDWLAARMPRPILLPGDALAELAVWKHTLENGRTAAHTEQRQTRDRQIVELVGGEGWSLRRVGRVFDLSHERVRQIVVAGMQTVATGPAA